MTIFPDLLHTIYRCTHCGAVLMPDEVMDNWYHQIIPEGDRWNYCGPVKTEVVPASQLSK